MQMWSLFSLLTLCFLDNRCQDPTTNLSPQKYVDAFAMAEALILTFTRMRVPSLCSLRARIWFLRPIQSYHSQEDGKLIVLPQGQDVLHHAEWFWSYAGQWQNQKQKTKKQKHRFVKNENSLSKNKHRWFKLGPFLIQSSSMVRKRTWFTPYK